MCDVVKLATNNGNVLEILLCPNGIKSTQPYIVLLQSFVKYVQKKKLMN